MPTLHSDDQDRIYVDSEGIYHRQFNNPNHGANGRFASGSGGAGKGTATAKKSTPGTSLNALRSAGIASEVKYKGNAMTGFKVKANGVGTISHPQGHVISYHQVTPDAASHAAKINEIANHLRSLGHDASVVKNHTGAAAKPTDEPVVLVKHPK